MISTEILKVDVALVRVWESVGTLHLRLCCDLQQLRKEEGETLGTRQSIHNTYTTSRCGYCSFTMNIVIIGVC